MRHVEALASMNPNYVLVSLTTIVQQSIVAIEIR